MPIAVDIALIPPAALMDDALALNERLPQPNPITLNRRQSIPHITLGMAVIDQGQIPELINRMDILMMDEELIQLHAFQLYVRRQAGQDVSGIAFSLTPALANLHAEAMEALLALDPQAPTVGSIEGASEIGQRNPEFPTDAEASQKAMSVTLETIAGYRDKAAYGNYFPHVTLGIGSLPGTLKWEPHKHTFTQVALVRLGLYCTAAEIVHQWSLKPAGSIVRGKI